MRILNIMNKLTSILCITGHFSSEAFVNLNPRNILSSKVASKSSCNLFMSYLDSLSKNNKDSENNKQQEYNWRPSQPMTTDQEFQKPYNDKAYFGDNKGIKGGYENRILASFKVGDKVRVISGGYAGNIGQVVNVYPDMVKVELSQTRTVLFEIQQIQNLNRNNEDSWYPQRDSNGKNNSNDVIYDNKSFMPSEARENFNLQRSSAGRYFNTSPTGEYDDRTVSSDILSSDQLNQFLKEMSAWKAHFFSDKRSKIEKFSRKFHCRNFQSALEAVNTIGLLAENSGYRLDLHVTSSSDVEIFILTQNTEGIVTLNDVELLKAMDAEITHNYST